MTQSLGAPVKGYISQIHTRTEPEAKEGLVLLAGEDHLSDTLNDLGWAARDPQLLSQLRTIIQRGAHAPEQRNLHELPVLPTRDEQVLAIPASRPVPEDTQPPKRQTDHESRSGLSSEPVLCSDLLWGPLKPALTERVSEQNFELWLSSVRFVSSNESRLVLRVPNTFFQEYLGEHYTEVIQEELLRKFNKHLDIEFVVPEETPQEEAPTKKETTLTAEETLRLSSRKEGDLPLARLEREWRAPLLPDFEPCDLAQAEQHNALEDLAWATAREKAIEQMARDSGQSLAYFASKQGQAKARWAAEDTLRKAEQAKRRAALIARLSPSLLTQPGDPQRQRQYEAPSAWAPEDGATRAKVKEASRALKAKPSKKDDSS